MTSLPHEPLTDGLYFGESPRYRDGQLYISDMTGRAIYTIDVSTGKKQVLVEVENQPNGMCFHPDGSLVYSSMFDAKLYKLKEGKSTLYADLSHVMTGYCGDMVIDRTGRVYVDDTGARVLHDESPRAGRLLVVDTDGTVKVSAEDIVFPNAVFISPDGRNLFVAETFGYGLLRYDVGADGQLTNRQNFWSPVSLPDLKVKKEDLAANMIGIDGGCMDAEGGMWLSLLAYEHFIRLDAEGNITDKIKVDGHSTACTLGGDDGKTLYLVINKVPPREKLFDAMVARRTTCNIATARVEVGRGNALP
ncbi:calcium-dependent phosphotriesterase [Coniochaeta ligniaria NRRL 30616]|uniref:Calcium-dependent phosphotriesterase n=1 Tax=Coniochaeta ligniaria NRRL 30616 TaxID=1408157 RepID=A0A1J7JZX5_9PEZI|nr:calcium-dependent phosphotriesterase [Coniochaeta ligniaria NRRL 30616]